jgi:hypothetical protein
MVQKLPIITHMSPMLLLVCPQLTESLSIDAYRLTHFGWRLKLPFGSGHG